jgi:hypothetical protein
LNAVEIEEAISQLADQPFDPANFPYAFLEAFGNKETTIKRLRAGASNKSDLGGVLQTSNIHIKVCAEGEVTKTLAALRESPSTIRAKAKFILATDGQTLEAENLASDDSPVACNYKDFPDHFGFFLPLAGISTVRQISENSFDIRATSRLNRLYVELLKDNPEWGTSARRHDMNHFMARLIFCFFAEDTDIFIGKGLFTDTITQMSARDSSNTNTVIETLFRAMNTKIADRDREGLPRWSNSFPYVNGGLFSGNMDVPRFSKIARSYLLHIGNLDWTKINPDIFGSMIQAVAEDEERGALGMHYTSVPNILKVLNPLFLDELRAKLAEAGDNPRTLLNLRKRIAKIRVFDPACGSGNFLVIAYKAMREIEAEINKRRGEPELRSEIPLTNYRGIELRDFPAEVARLALVIAEYQCDVLYRGQKLALAEFLPLRSENWITCGNALRLDWLSICPPTGTGVKLQADDLFSTPLDQAQIDFENEGGETYICGNPPYKGAQAQESEQKDDLKRIFEKQQKRWPSLDYISGWFFRAGEYLKFTDGAAAFVSTNSISQGEQVPLLWPLLEKMGHEIFFCYTSFKWANLAAHNAGVIVVVIGFGAVRKRKKTIYETREPEGFIAREVTNINPYLISAENILVEAISGKSDARYLMYKGNQPSDGGFLCLGAREREELLKETPEARQFIRRYVGGEELIKGKIRYCIWADASSRIVAEQIPSLKSRFDSVAAFRATCKAPSTRARADVPHKFIQIQAIAKEWSIVVARVSSERRSYIPVDLYGSETVASDQAFALYDSPLWNLSLIASRLHLVWIATVCGKLKTDFRYSNTLGWNTFPVPTLTEKNKTDLTRCAEDILLVREHHFPATIADLYDPESMPEDLRQAHERNDEVFERIYIGRRFKNDTERLEKLFELYTKMTKAKGAA